MEALISIFVATSLGMGLWALSLWTVSGFGDCDLEFEFGVMDGQNGDIRELPW